MNYEYIATKLCENKDKPALKCNGKCHLMKELAKESDTGKPISEGSKKSVLEKENLYFVDLKQNILIEFFDVTTKVTDSYRCIYFQEHKTAIFHPPIFQA